MKDSLVAYYGEINVGGRDATRLAAIVLFAAGDKNTASTRLRLLTIQSALRPDTSRELHSMAEAQSLNPEIVWFQKKLTREYIDAAHLFKKRGCLVVYDCDDSGEALAYWASSRYTLEMMNLADLIVTDTPERAKWARLALTSSRIAVVENEMDYSFADCGVPDIRAPSEAKGLRVLWYGNATNLRAIAKYTSIFKNQDEYQLVICSSTPEAVSKVLPGVPAEWCRWSAHGFIDILKSCDVTLLSHFGTEHDLRKSAHKMITSICHGVPAIVSKSPDYLRVARSVGLSEAVFDNDVSLRRALEWLSSPGARNDYLARAQDRLLSKYRHGAFVASATKEIQLCLDSTQAKDRTRSLLDYLPELIRKCWYKGYDKVIWSRIA